MEKLLQHVTLAIVLSALVSVAIETVKNRLKKQDVTLQGRTWFIVSIFISLLVGVGYTMYYQQLPIDEAILVWLIMVFGAQGFYDVLLDKKPEETDKLKYNELKQKGE